MRPDGTYDDFAYEEYTEHIGEHIEPWTYVKMPFAKNWADGQFSMDLDNPLGIYRSQLAVAHQCLRPDGHSRGAEGAGATSASSSAAQSQLTLLYHWARLIELVNNCERADRAARGSGDHRPGHPRGRGGQGRRGRGLCRGASRYPDPSLRGRRQRA